MSRTWTVTATYAVIFVARDNGRFVFQACPVLSEFMDAYYSALANLPENRPRTVGRPAAGSFGHVCLSYYASPTFKRLAQSTQSWRRRALDSICEQHGDKRIALMSAKHVRILRNEMAKLPGASRNRLKALKALFAWAVDEGLATDDPTINVKNIPYVTKSHHTWTSRRSGTIRESPSCWNEGPSWVSPTSLHILAT